VASPLRLKNNMRVLVTGSQGFIGKNLVVHLEAQAGWEVLRFDRGDDMDMLEKQLTKADAVVHLAGENRPADPADFTRVNSELTTQLCQAIAASGRDIKLILASSTQAELDNPYGLSKRAGEQAAQALAATGAAVIIHRLPSVFGKWCKPNYNSVVATFCHNIARDLPIEISDAARVITLVYIDDVIGAFMSELQQPVAGLSHGQSISSYQISLGELVEYLRAFRQGRNDLHVERVGQGLIRALYATYVSYLPMTDFAYPLRRHADSRGVFVEMLKTSDSGQFSYFTALPGVTRGSHFHHTKSEKFLVIKGRARFRFRHIVTGERHEVMTSGEVPYIVESVPGWAHDITNIADEELVVMLWANENFNQERSDTQACKV
jgi:UDP-2-acetamido-2,6-beta-L-arabino-hexul-4-ose reductase